MSTSSSTARARGTGRRSARPASSRSSSGSRSTIRSSDDELHQRIRPNPKPKHLTTTTERRDLIKKRPAKSQMMDGINNSSSEHTDDDSESNNSLSRSEKYSRNNVRSKKLRDLAEEAAKARLEIGTSSVEDTGYSKSDEEVSIHTDSDDARAEGDATNILELFNAAQQGLDQDAIRILEAEPNLILSIRGCGCSKIELDRLMATIPQKGDTPLHFAARGGQVSTVRELVRFIKDHTKPFSSISMKLLGMENGDGDTPLHVALKNQHLDLATYLIHERPEVAYQVNKVGVSPLFLAVEGRLVDIVEDVFLRFPGCFVSESRKKSLLRAKNAPLIHAAIAAGNSEMVRKILENLPILIESWDRGGRTPLSHAAYDGCHDVVDYILAKFPKSVERCDKDGLFPIHNAIAGGHISVIKNMVRRSPQTKYQVGKRGETIIDIANNSGRVRVFSYLRSLPDHDFEKIANSKIQDIDVKSRNKTKV